MIITLILFLILNFGNTNAIMCTIKAPSGTSVEINTDWIAKGGIPNAEIVIGRNAVCYDCDIATAELLRDKFESLLEENGRMPVVDIVTEKEADKSMNLILIGGPVDNTLTADLINAEKSKIDWYNSIGDIEVIKDAFTTGKYAIIIGGKDSDATRKAAEAFIKGLNSCISSTSISSVTTKCTEGFTGNRKCSGNIVEQEYKYADCTTEWRYYRDCDELDSFIGEKYCKGDDIYQKYRDYFCSNGKCDYNEFEKYIRTCEYGCENGVCLEPSKLHIETVPSGAGVYINGEYKGLTPITIPIKKGSHTLLIRKSGYKDYKTRVFLSSGEYKDISIELEEIGEKTYKKTEVEEKCIIDISSSPSGAEVYIDGEFIGKTPIMKEVLCGKYYIEVKKEGYELWEKVVELSEDNPKFEEAVTLSPSKKLEISGFEIDQKYLAIIPIVLGVLGFLIRLLRG